MKLSKRALGQSGIDVSCLGLGTVKFGRNQEVKYPRGFALPEDREISNLLALARDLGVNFLDTAPAYGSSEQRLGRLLTDRDYWVLGTKVGEEFLTGKSVYDFSAEHTRESIERSLRHLNTDYLDLVLIHSNGDDLKILENSDCLGALIKLKEKGLIRAIGMSTKTVAGGMRAVDLTDVVMVSLNRDYLDELPVIEHAHDAGKGVLIKKALNSGHVAETGVSSDPVGESLRFALATAGVSSVIAGTINGEHLRSNVAAVADR